jgi:hypothetical protein
MKLLSGGRMGSIFSFHLPLPDHMHYFDTGQDDAGATKILEAEHAPRALPSGVGRVMRLMAR